MALTLSPPLPTKQRTGSKPKFKPYQSESEDAMRQRANHFMFPIFPALMRMCLDNYYAIVLLGTFVFALFETLVYVFQVLWPSGVYFLLFWLIFWLIIIFWDFVMIFTVFIGIPLLNLGLAISVFVLNLLIIFYIIGSTVWNAIVPFLGMLLKLFLDLVLGILTQVFQLLGSINLQPFFDALSEILPPIVEIVVTVLQVLIEVGSNVIKVVVVVIRPLLQVFLDILKTVVQIVSWLVKPLFDILEPILYFIGLLFGSTDTGGSQAYAGRKLLSLGLSVMLGVNPAALNQNSDGLSDDTFDTVLSNFTDYGGDFYNLTRADQLLVARYHLFLKENLEPGGGDPNKKFDLTRALSDQLLQASKEIDRINGKTKHYNREDFEIVDGRLREKNIQDYNTGRKPLSSNIEMRGSSIDDDEEIDDDDFKFNVGTSKLDDLSHQTAYAWHRGIKTLNEDNWRNAMSSYNEIRSLQSGKRDNHLAQNALRYTYRQTIGSKYRVPFEKSLANVQYTSPPEDPFDVAVRLEKEKEKVIMGFAQSPREFSGRQLLAFSNQWSEAQKNHINAIEVKNAKMVMEAQEKYVDYHYTHYKIVDSVYNGITTTLREYAEGDFHPNTFKQWWNDALDYYGYTDIWHIRQDFLDTHKNTSNFVQSLAVHLDNPILNYIRSLNENSKDNDEAENKFFSNWEQAETARHSFSSGRRLSQYESPTNPALDSFALLSTKSCFTKKKEDRNTLCVPEWPPDKMVKPVSVTLKESTKEAILTSSYFCSPWKENKALFAINTDNLFNFLQEIRFLLSAIPFINYNIATLTLIAPWTGWFLDWIFLIPKFKHPTAFQIVCFVRHLYDFFIVGVFLFFLAKFVFPIVTRIYRVVAAQWYSWNRSKMLFQEELARGESMRLHEKVEEIEERLSELEEARFNARFDADVPDAIQQSKIHKKKKKVSKKVYLNLVQTHNQQNIVGHFNEDRAIEHMRRLDLKQ